MRPFVRFALEDVAEKQTKLPVTLTPSARKYTEFMIVARLQSMIDRVSFEVSAGIGCTTVNAAVAWWCRAPGLVMV